MTPIAVTSTPIAWQKFQIAYSPSTPHLIPILKSMAQVSGDYDSLILSRLCQSTPVLNQAAEIFFKAKAPCTSPGNEHFLGDFRPGLPAFCAFIAAEKLDTNEVPLEKALMAACLNRDEFERGVGTVKKAAGLTPTLQAKQSLSYYRPTMRTPTLPSPSLLPPGQNGYLYQILEPIHSPSTQASKSQSVSARRTKRKRTEDPPGEAAGGSSQPPNKTDARDREFETEIKKLRDANDSLRNDNKTLTDENEHINTRLTSLQHLIHRERFDREERDIEEHQELTLLRTALVQLESYLPSMLSEISTAPVASTSTQTPLAVIADAITAVENMARRRLVITEFPDVETYVEPDDEHAQVEDGVHHTEKGVDEVDQVMLDVDEAREVGTTTTNGAPTIYAQTSKTTTKKALPTPAPETFSTTLTAIFEDGAPPDHGTMVWARIASHPWYPAVIHDENVEGIPANVLASKPKQASSPSKDDREKVWCVVNFFDEKRSWGWVPLQKLRMLGNEQVLDDDMLALKSRMQRKWPSRERAKVLAAYQAAMDNIAPEGDEEELQLSSLEEISMI